MYLRQMLKCRWCCNPWLPMIFCYVSIWVLLWRSSWFLSVATGGFLLNILSTIISLSCILWGLRFLIARLVRYSVDCSVQATLDTINIIRERDVQTRIVIVGFSWGGHILAEMLHRQVFPGPALLLAPTINAVASVCNSKLPQFRTSHELCKVVHASDDGFCPHSQHGHLRSCGAECVVVDDGHPLNNGRSLATILRLFKELL